MYAEPLPNMRLLVQVSWSFFFPWGFALRGMTECWRDELRRHNVRVMLVNPSEVMTEFAAKAGVEREASDKKLRPQEIASAILGALKIDGRGFIPEFSVFATNPF